MQLAEFPKDFAGTLIVGFGRLDGHFDNLVAPLAGTRIHDALLAQAEALASVGPLRDLQLGPAIDGRHFDLGPQRRLPHRQRNFDFDVIAIAVKEGVLLHPNLVVM